MCVLNDVCIFTEWVTLYCYGCYCCCYCYFAPQFKFHITSYHIECMNVFIMCIKISVWNDYKHYHLIWINTRTSSPYTRQWWWWWRRWRSWCSYRCVCARLFVRQNPLPLTLKPMHSLHFMVMLFFSALAVFKDVRCSYHAHSILCHECLRTDNEHTKCSAQ